MFKEELKVKLCFSQQWGEKLKYFIFHIIKYKINSEWVMSSVPSFAYGLVCAYKCFVKYFLVLHPILMTFLVLCLFDFSLFIQINLMLGWSCPLKSKYYNQMSKAVINHLVWQRFVLIFVQMRNLIRKEGNQDTSRLEERRGADGA